MRATVRVKWKVGALAAAIVVGTAGWTAVGGGGSARAATEPGGTWGQPQDIPGIAPPISEPPPANQPNAVKAITCTSLGNCTAVGYYGSTSSKSQPFVATETDGTWGNAQPVSGAPVSSEVVTALDDVSCGAPGYCAAFGVYYNSSFDELAFLATEVNGAWTAQTLPGTIGPNTVQDSRITSVSCTDARDCTAVGWYTATPSGGGAFTLDESNGTWGTPQPVSGLPTGGLSAVSCSSPGNCTAGGDYNAGGVAGPFLVSESGGTWGSAQAVPDFAALNTTSSGQLFGAVTSLSCPDVTDCAVGGYYGIDTGAPTGTTTAVFTADEVGGTWDSAKPLDIPSAVNGPYDNFTVGCRAAGNCVVTGNVTVVTGSGTSAVQHGEAFAATETSGGGWGQGQALPGIPASDGSYSSGLSCIPGGGCTMAGGYGPVGVAADQAFAATVGTDGSIGTVQLVEPALNDGPQVAGIACPQDGYCTLIDNPGGIPQLVSEATAATVTLSASAPAVSYGSEPAETFTATVSSVSGGTPTGTVAVTGPAGYTGTACTITLAGGTGSCSFPSTQFPVGTVTVTGSYSGDANYIATSGTASVTVANGEIAVGAEGGDGQLWAQAPQLGAGWHALGGTLIAPPAVAAAPNPYGSTPAQPLFIATSANSQLYIRSLSTGWRRLGSAAMPCAGGPAAVIAGGTLTVACRGPGNALWENSAPVPAAGLPQIPQSQPWASLGGVLTAGPAVAPVGGTLTFFVRGTNGHIYLRTLASGWRVMPWSCIGAPAAAAEAASSDTIFACQGGNHMLYEAVNGGTGWSSAVSLGGSLIGGPAVAALSRAPEFLAEGPHQAVWERTLVAGWTSLGLAVVGGVGAVALN